MFIRKKIHVHSLSFILKRNVHLFHDTLNCDFRIPAKPNRLTAHAKIFIIINRQYYSDFFWNVEQGITPCEII